MAPFFLKAAASVAGNVIDRIAEQFSHHPGVRKHIKAAKSDFAAVLSSAQPAAAPPPVNAKDLDAAAIRRVLSSPEVSSALAGANPAQPVQVELSATGSLALRGASGDVRPLKISDATRSLAANLYHSHRPVSGPGVAALAIDPANPATCEWSTLPPRTA